MARIRRLHIGLFVTLATLVGWGVASAQTAKTAPEADARELNLRAYAELLRSDLRSQKVAVITDATNRELAGEATRSIVLSGRIDELYTPIPYIIPAQILAGLLAAEKGLDPDRPRTLRKITRTL